MPLQMHPYSLLPLVSLFLAHLIEENLHEIPEVEDGFHESVEMSGSHSVTERERERDSTKNGN